LVGSLKSPCRVLVKCNWTSFLSLTVEALQGKTCQDSLLSGGVGQFETRFQGKGSSLWNIFLVSTKWTHFANCIVLRAAVLTQYRRVTDGRRTDRQTDGIAVARTALAMRALRRAVKMYCNFFYESRCTLHVSPSRRNACSNTNRC